jgi:hypothetical protein
LAFIWILRFSNLKIYGGNRMKNIRGFFIFFLVINLFLGFKQVVNAVVYDFRNIRNVKILNYLKDSLEKKSNTSEKMHKFCVKKSIFMTYIGDIEHVLVLVPCLDEKSNIIGQYFFHLRLNNVDNLNCLFDSFITNQDISFKNLYEPSFGSFSRPNPVAYKDINFEALDPRDQTIYLLANYKTKFSCLVQEFKNMGNVIDYFNPF